MKTKIFISILLSFFVISVFAQEKQKGVGIGFQSIFPAWGISGMCDVSDRVSIQEILGPFGDLKIYAGRGIYRFKKESYWNTYAYGMIGAWSYPYPELKGLEIVEKTERVIGFGTGAGIEYNWQHLFSDLPPVWWNLEIGLTKVKFKEAPLNLSAVTMGAGAHYRF